MKRMVLVAALLVVASAFIFATGKVEGAASTKTWVMKLSHDNAETHQWHLAALKFAEAVNKGSNGALKVEIYSGGQLGDIRTVSESLITGNIEFCINGGGYLGNYSKPYQIMEMPYLFKDHAHMNKALNGEAGAIGNAELETRGLRVVSWWNRAPRQTLSRKSIQSINDIVGLKIRVPEIEAHVLAWKAMGTNPTPITWSEVFTSATQGIIDAVENPVSTMYGTRLHQPLKYVAMTGHCYSNAALFTGMATWKKLTPKQQQVIMDAAKQSKLWIDKDTETEEKVYIDKMKAEGVTAAYPDVEPFRKAAMSAHTTLATKYSMAFYQAVIAAGK